MKAHVVEVCKAIRNNIISFFDKNKEVFVKVFMFFHFSLVIFRQRNHMLI